ncbi:MAG: type I-G CRISPR-associated helicase/endonuclease Cas3g [Phycisphaerales bacterium]
MMMRFDEFFAAVHEGLSPFPWQSMLAEQLAATRVWPKVIDLPTASGKTAVLDIAVWHLAQQAELPPQERTAPRRIWFVVDRRIVVDEAYHRAEKIAAWLLKNGDSDVSQALRTISGFDAAREIPPLSVGRLRGGVLQDTGWASFPSQPAILTSTVDQFGSRLLFRGYGMGPGMWPIHAALAGNDALLVLDEAHLAGPLMQTLEAFERYRGKDWCEEQLALPWQMTMMSATPPANDCSHFPTTDQRSAALDHEKLRRRMNASKRAWLVPVALPKSSKKRPATACAHEAAVEAVKFVEAGRHRIAVMMNRVDAAVAAYDELHTQLEGQADVVLLTGRMRPFDREKLVEQLEPILKSGSTQTPGKPIVLVTTQCLEVGADFSFDALATECASLDALRQRFGRLDRLGELGTTEAVILAWHGDAADDANDPIYGQALRKTWNWLNEIAENKRVDFGIAAMQAKLDEVGDLSQMLPHRPNAPVLLPAYLDAWCQTGPKPHVEAEPSLFLHGPTAEQADVQVAFRRDLTEALDDEQWAKLVGLTPPVSGELLTVKLHRMCQWLAGESVVTESDVEGSGEDGEHAPDAQPPKRWVQYRGRSRNAEVVDDPKKLCPGDMLILSAEGWHHIPRTLGHGEQNGLVDIHEQAVAKSGRPQTFRLTRTLVNQWAREREDAVPLDVWLDVKDDESPDMDQWPEMSKLLQEIVPQDLNEAIKHLGKTPRLDKYADGFILTGPRPTHATKYESDPFEGGDDSLSLIGQPVSLELHTQQVVKLARQSAEQCVPTFAGALEKAAALHDEGKTDPRFQALLCNVSIPVSNGEPLAKSGRSGSQRDRELRHELGIEGFRHEMLSMQKAAEKYADDLLLHLIASHHGHARPFAPLFDDSVWQNPPPHHLGSGVAERFWTMTRRYGWWGLAYLEAVLRLADQHASRFPRQNKSEEVTGD